VDERANGVDPDEPQYPRDQQDDGDGVQHVNSPGALSGSRSRAPAVRPLTTISSREWAGARTVPVLLKRPTGSRPVAEEHANAQHAAGWTICVNDRQTLCRESAAAGPFREAVASHAQANLLQVMRGQLSMEIPARGRRDLSEAGGAMSLTHTSQSPVATCSQ
jgi:hypothetical protein